jgi:hypothetical protein
LSAARVVRDGVSAERVFPYDEGERRQGRIERGPHRGQSAHNRMRFPPKSSAVDG